jgi:hypothetical protein
MVKVISHIPNLMIPIVIPNIYRYNAEIDNKGSYILKPIKEITKEKLMKKYMEKSILSGITIYEFYDNEKEQIYYEKTMKWIDIVALLYEIIEKKKLESKNLYENGIIKVTKNTLIYEDNENYEWVDLIHEKTELQYGIPYSTSLQYFKEIIHICENTNLCVEFTITLNNEEQFVYKFYID